nr:group II intron reverse transcriptase/maturase [Candidatus Paracaedibacter symbiosus]
MTVMEAPKAGASSAYDKDWNTIDWQPVIAHVHRLQMRIAKAYREGKKGKVHSLQRLLTHSYYAKLLAVKRIVQNRGAKTPGIDGVVWKTSRQKIQAARSLKRKGYKTQPLRRIYIPKKTKGTFRPLSIPTMECRAQQALHLLSLEPIAEMIADKNAYGFRPLRSTADAIARCFDALARKDAAEYILEGDIKSCFDSISGTWLQDNVPMDKRMLKKWLAAGYIEKGRFYSMENGTPQGGTISPALLVIALSGLETVVKAVARRQDKVNICIYCDDFIITGATREVLEIKVRPAVEAFLQERGLSLSQEKTKITHINEGIDFLGMNIRKYKGKCIIKPAKSNVKRFLTEIREIIESRATAKTEEIVQRLNSKIRGWGNYYRHVCSKQTFSYVDAHIFFTLWRWSKRRHPNKGRRWIRDKYFLRYQQRNWVFSVKTKDKNGNQTYLRLMEASKIPIQRHIKIRAEATPYDPNYQEYLGNRLIKRKGGQPKRTKWSLLWENLLKLQDRKAGSSRNGLIKA